MFVTFLLIFVVIAMLLLKLLVMNEKKNSNNTSREVIKICQDKEADNDKDNDTLSEMIKFHKSNTTIRYNL